MPVGSSAYEPPSYNKEDEEEIKLQDAVYSWWENLSDDEQWVIIEDWVAEEELTEESYADIMFGGMLFDEQYEIYKANNPQAFMTPDELYDGGVSGEGDMAGDAEYEERKLMEDDIE